MVDIQRLIQRKKFLLSKLANPLSPDKRDLSLKLYRMDKNLLRHNQIRYFCSFCKFFHYRGRIYTEHKSFAILPRTWPELKAIPVDFEYHVCVDTLSFDNLWSKFRFSTKFHLKFDSQSNQIFVLKHKKKIGVLCHPINNQLFSALQDSNVQLFTSLRVFPKYLRNKIIKTRYAELDIIEFHPEMLVTILSNLRELIQLGHPDVSSAILRLSPRALAYAEQYLFNLEDNRLLQIINAKRFSSKIKSNSHDFIL